MALLAGTPLWVWLVLGLVLWSGWRARHPGLVTPARLLVLPLVLLALALPAAGRAGGEHLPALLLGALAGLAVGAMAAWPLRPRWAGPGQVALPGGWSALLLGLAGFGLQYWQGYRQAALAAPPFWWLLLLGPGLLLGRAGTILWRAGRGGRAPLTPPAS